MRNWMIRLGVCTLSAALLTNARAADFTGIGFLHPDDNVSGVSALSADGTFVAGLSYRTYSLQYQDGTTEYHRTYRRGMVWSPATGMQALEPSAPPDQFGYDDIYDIAPQGASVFGSSSGLLDYFNGTTVGSYESRGPFQWTPSSNFSVEQGVTKVAFSHDVNTYAGTQGAPSYWGATTAFRHSPAGTEVLGWLPGVPGYDDFHGPYSRATGISANGGVVVGNSTSGASYVDNRNITSVIATPVATPTPNLTMGGAYSIEAFRWTESGGIVGLGDLPEGTFASVATGVSGDGNTVIGTGNDENGGAGFRWTQQSGMVRIGGLLAGGTSQPNGVSFDGSKIVGSSKASYQYVTYPPELNSEGGYFDYQYAAIIWDAEHGVRNLKDVLQTDYGLDLSGWQLLSATDISDDGLTIAGNGFDPLGREQGWIVHLVPEPSSFVLLLISITALLGFNPRKRLAI